jgi:hypothetical protein
MNFVVVSSYENTNGGDLQEQGRSVSLQPNPGAAREHYESRLKTLYAAAQRRETEGGAALDSSTNLVVWVAVLELPVDAEDLDEALETIEMIIEEAEDVEEELDFLMVAYDGTLFSADGQSSYERKFAIDNLQAWLS